MIAFPLVGPMELNHYPAASVVGLILYTEDFKQPVIWFRYPDVATF